MTFALFSIYILGIAIFLASLTGKVKYGLLFLIPLIPLQNVMNKLYQFPFGKDFNDILIIGMLIGWVIYKNSIGKPIAERTSYNKIIFFYLIFTYIISILRSMSIDYITVHAWNIFGEENNIIAQSAKSGELNPVRFLYFSLLSTLRRSSGVYSKFRLINSSFNFS